MLVIETNILEDANGEVADHQSRIIEVGSWDDYVGQYIKNKPLHYRGTMIGFSFKESWEMIDLFYDETHLICEFDDDFGFTVMKLAYRLEDEFELDFIEKRGSYLC